MKYKDIVNAMVVKTSRIPVYDVVAIIAVMVAKIIWYLYEDNKLTEAQVRNILDS